LLTLTGISLKANRDSWVKDIGFFKENCHKDLPIAPNLDIANIKKGGYEAEEEEAKASAAGGKMPAS